VIYCRCFHLKQILNIEIRNIETSELESAVIIFTEGFLEEPLHIMAFPEIEKRKRLTKLVYELIVYHIVPEMKMKLKGAFAEGVLAGVLDYTPPNTKSVWSDSLGLAVEDMRKKANDESINLISEYAMKCGSVKPEETHYYLNDIAVLKSFRGKGIGRMLFEYVENECRQNADAKCIALDATNNKNVSLYESWGYKVFKEIEFYDLICYKMKKDL
jgi:GNAT superfamily N-acetyltransferase